MIYYINTKGYSSSELNDFITSKLRMGLGIRQINKIIEPLSVQDFLKENEYYTFGIIFEYWKSLEKRAPSDEA